MELSNIFSDNMVFQAEKPVRFFGFGKGKIAVTILGVTYERTFDTDRWCFELGAQAYGGPYDITVRLDERTTLLKNIAFGDVLLCAGQSNIQFTVSEETDASAIEDDDKIRCYISDIRKIINGEQPAAWSCCTAGGVGGWSALGLHIAQNYRKHKDVYVGIVGCYMGASAIRSWLPASALDESVFVPLEKRHTDHVTRPIWNKDSMLYDNCFMPIAPFSFKHVVWYQGESDTTVEESRVYTQMLARLVTSWRQALDDGTLPFTVVEICDYEPRDDDGWHLIQQCQRDVVRFVTNVSVVESKDVCEHTAIHPSNKEKLAKKITDDILKMN